MKKLILLIALIYNLLASTEIENNFVPLSNNFTNIEKEYISSKTVSLGMMVDNYPFSFQEGDKISGFSYDYINLIMKKSGLKLKIQMGTWASTFNKFKNKHIDMIDVISYKKDREAFTNFSKPYFEIGNVLFVRKGEFNHYTGLESLRGRRLGIMKGIFYYDTIKKLQLFDLVEYETSKDLMNALAYAKVDAIIDNVIVGQEFIKKAGFTNIKILEELESSMVKKEDLRLGIKKEDKVLFSIINKSMAAISREEKEILYNKWFSVKTEEENIKNNVSLTEAETQWIKKKHIVKVRVANIPPFQIYKNGKASGISVDYIKKIFHKYNIQYKFIPYDKFTFPEALNEIKNKNGVDLILAVKKTEKRTKDMLFTMPYLYSPLVIFTRENSSFIEKIEDLDNKIISVQEGYLIQKRLENEYPNINLYPIKSDEATKDSLEAVAVGKADAYIGDLSIASFIIKENGFSNLKIAAPSPFKNHANSIAVRNDWKELVGIINKELNSWSNKEKNEIRNKYLSLEYVNGIQLKDVLIIVLSIVVFFSIILALFYYSNRKLNIQIKKRIEAENELKDNNSKLIAFYNLCPLGIVLTSKDGKYIEFNDSFEKICGYSKEELNKLDFWELTPEKYKDDEQKQLNLISKTKAYGPFEKEYIQKNGNLIPVNLNGMVVTNSKGEDYIWSIVEDISERKEKERILIHQNKMAAMGEMLGNIAHQWRQPLSTISTGATGAKIQKELGTLSDSNLNSILSTINESAQYLSSTIDDFRGFLNPTNDKVNKFNISDTFEKAFRLISAQFIAKDIEIIQNIENFEIISIENELIQVLINILNNARDALLKIENEKKYIFIETYKNDDQIVIEIKDNAEGIPENIIDRIFDPYFTTKHKSQGTGIGLYMSEEIIGKHLNGSLTVSNDNYSYEGIDYIGAKFTIELALN